LSDQSFGPTHSNRKYHLHLVIIFLPYSPQVTPKFCKRYADVGLVVQRALEEYRDDVRTRGFPSEQYSPYAIPDGDYEAFEKEAGKAGLLRKSRKAHVHDEEHIKLY
jgi:3-methyl-2-oxobutanoate hydroxymethyltransferase